MNERFNREWLIKELSERYQFTKGDVKILMDGFKEICEEVVENQDILHIPALFTLQVTPMKPKKYWNMREKKILEYSGSFRVKFTPSQLLSKRAKVAHEESLEEELEYGE